MKELSELNAIYQKMSTPDVDEAMIVTNADKKGNTPAYQNFKKGMKGKDGKPMYKAADHMKESKKAKKDHDEKILSPISLLTLHKDLDHLTDSSSSC